MPNYISKLLDLFKEAFNYVVNMIVELLRIPDPPEHNIAVGMQSLNSTQHNVMTVANDECIKYIIQAHNTARLSIGANPLKHNSILSSVASNQAHIMCHENDQLNQHTISSIIKQAGYKNVIVGLNTARGFTSPQAIMQKWLESPEHKSNIVRKQFKEIGIGIIDDCCCVIFASHLIMTDRMHALGYEHYLANELTTKPIINQ